MSQAENNEFSEAQEVSEDKIEKSSCADGQDSQKPEVAKEVKFSTQENEKASEKQPENAEQGKDEQGVYKEVLEKLNLPTGPNAEQKDIQEKSMQAKQLENVQAKIQIENIVAQDFQKIENFMRLGLINPLQGQNLKNQVMKKAFDMTLQNGMINQNLSPASKVPSKDDLFSEFNQSNPNFFEQDGRKEVFDYLKSDEVMIGRDDLKKISVMIQSIEKKAIDGYLKKEAYQKNLKESNDAAKQKLTANAQNSSFADKNLSRTFTREQIGKMSSTEFAKYEPVIMEQLKKGLIR